MNNKRPPQRSSLTINDVAAAAGVSRSTVSLVLGNSKLVAEATSDKVRETINRLGYVYNRKAAIRARMSHLVGIVIPDLTNPFFSELTAGIDTVLNKAGWISLLGNSWESVAGQDRILQRMQEHMVDAVIVCPAVDTLSVSQMLADPGLRVLQVLRQTEGVNNYLGIDYVHGVASAVEHLVGLGHSDIVFLGGERHHSAAAERRQGFEAAMQQHGLVPRYVSCPLTRPAAAEAVTGLFRTSPPTALVCFNDVTAIGAMGGLERLGLIVGKDVSVVGFDNIAEAAFINPQLTTIDSNARRLGETAAELVLGSIRDGTSLEGRTATPTSLVVRGSTGPAPAEIARTDRRREQ